MLFDLTFSCYLTTFSGKKCLSGKVICAFFFPLIEVLLYVVNCQYVGAIRSNRPTDDVYLIQNQHLFPFPRICLGVTSSTAHQNSRVPQFRFDSGNEAIIGTLLIVSKWEQSDPTDQQTMSILIKTSILFHFPGFAPVWQVARPTKNRSLLKTLDFPLIRGTLYDLRLVVDWL
jgi:hypothetical protein